MMKKFISIAFLAFVAVFASYAAEVTFDFGNNEFKLPTTSNNNDPSGDISVPVTKSGIVITSKKENGTTSPRMWYSEYNNTTDLRFYTGNKFEIATSDGSVIKSIRFVSNGKFNVTPAPGEFDLENYETWNGSATKVVFDVDGSTQLYTITVNTEEGESCTPPSFSPEAGDFYEELAVELTCLTEGASIYYTTDGTNPTINSLKYSSPVMVAQNMTIKAIGVKGNAVSEVAEASYFFPEVQEVGSISEFLGVDDAEKLVRIVSPVVAVFQSSKYLYIKDSTGAVQLYGDLGKTYSKGDVIPAGIVGYINNYEGTPQMLPVAKSFKLSIGKEDVLPKPVNISDFNESILNEYVKGSNWDLAIKKSGNGFTYTLSENGNTLPVFKRFNSVVFPEEEGKYDVEGFVNLFGGTMQIYPTLFTKSSGVDGINTDAYDIFGVSGGIKVCSTSAVPVSVYTIMGQKIIDLRISSGETVIEIPSGIYVVSIGEKRDKILVR